MNKILYKNHNIKKAGSILLLLVFTLGITPKKTLHDWFANHKDSTSKTSTTNIPQLTRAGFNCQCDDLVAESHFITAASLVVVSMPSLHSYFLTGIPAFISSSLFFFNLRGPPLKF